MSDFVPELVSGEDRRALNVDVFKPDSSNGVAIILLHGGGWASGNRAMTHGYGTVLASMGFVAIAAEYRLLPEAPWPSQVQDVRDVVRWTRDNSGRLEIDPAKIALQGYSAGAHIALMVAGTQPGSGNEAALPGDPAGSEVAAVVSFFAPARLPIDPAELARQPLAALLAGGGETAARAASPIYLANPHFPTTFLLGGMSDYMHPLESGLDHLKAFVDAGVEVEFHYLHSQRHEFAMTPGMTANIMAEVAFFYRRTLLDRAELEKEAFSMNPFARAANREEFGKMMAAGS